ncbi:MAG TPA: UDP-N-acetylmuramoyl-tripeptide--D-alanyl-D-alanine ligase [Steroidobacteraceae bacterium]|jgi:UDP-N-acetylmuramoyl-tripeptide--D-alanyl-D-alanine ligase|nr:UDP-N-acetylmuramoyl-tripeptide--D-alanyl-D-alanine ligase [Steroidobacteraceae bacterium]
MNATLTDFAHSCGGRLVGPDAPFSGVSTDSRTINCGELFVALSGPRFNGEDYVAAAVARGAAGAVVRSPRDNAGSQILVADTLAALARSARAWRESFSIPVIGVAGSNGKTTVKELISSILSQAGPCLSTRGNLNNHIGVPLTLFRIRAEHRFAVVEMGADRAGEVEALVRIGRPTIGIITNAGAEHLEGFGSLEGVARAEGEMVAGLRADATAIINHDDPFALLWKSMTPARVLTFGLEPGAQFSAGAPRTTIDATGFVTRFTLHAPQGSVPVELHLAGRHNLINALGAAAAASAAGLGLAEIARGLAAARAVPGRLQFKQAPSGAWIIDDSYNANPSSVQAAIQVLAQLDGQRWLVFADMGELGEYATETHRQVGLSAKAAGIERLFATGKLAQLAVETFGAGASWFTDTSSLAAGLNAELSSIGSEAGAVRMLVKGSRFNRLEHVVAALAATPATPGTQGV